MLVEFRVVRLSSGNLKLFANLFWLLRALTTGIYLLLSGPFPFSRYVGQVFRVSGLT